MISKQFAWLMFITTVLLTLINIFISFHINKQLNLQSKDTLVLLDTINLWEVEVVE